METLISTIVKALGNYNKELSTILCNKESMFLKFEFINWWIDTKKYSKVQPFISFRYKGRLYKLTLEAYEK